MAQSFPRNRDERKSNDAEHTIDEGVTAVLIFLAAFQKPRFSGDLNPSTILQSSYFNLLLVSVSGKRGSIF